MSLQIAGFSVGLVTPGQHADPGFPPAAGLLVEVFHQGSETKWIFFAADNIGSSLGLTHPKRISGPNAEKDELFPKALLLANDRLSAAQQLEKAVQGNAAVAAIHRGKRLSSLSSAAKAYLEAHGKI